MAKKRTPEQERQRQARRRESKRAARKCHDCANPAEPDRIYCTACLNRRRATPMTYFERVERQMTAVAPDPIAERLPEPIPLRDALVTSLRSVQPAAWDDGPNSERLRCDKCGNLSMAQQLNYSCCGAELSRFCVLCALRADLPGGDYVPTAMITQRALSAHARKHGAPWARYGDACPCCGRYHRDDITIIGGGLCDHDHAAILEGLTVHQLIDQRDDPADECADCWHIGRVRMMGQSPDPFYQYADAAGAGAYPCHECQRVRPAVWTVAALDLFWCRDCLPVDLVGSRHLAEYHA